jgi:hypothetical protein
LTPADCNDSYEDKYDNAEYVGKRKGATVGLILGNMPSERCENCGGKIGKLQTPHVWDNHIVCAECHRKLSIEKQPAVASSTTQAGAEIPTAVEPLDYHSPTASNATNPNLMNAIKRGVGAVFLAPPPYDPSSPRQLRYGEIICPNARCGYVGYPRRAARGSIAVGCLLTLIFLVPGILYFLFFSGYRYLCPNCGVQLSAEN